ncbi:MAG: MATE family efflux transporter [Candidatus Cloacimonadota bacterium]|nr:MAG: MATE family efflux transporter [Candidatus Cloacimonadota bacterium]
MLISKSRLITLLNLAVPIIGGMLSQNLLNIVDTAMVGRLGSEALAAVGLSGFLNFMSVALLMGFSTGVQAISARRIGENKKEQAANPLNMALIIIIFVASFISGVVYLLIPTILPLLNPDPVVVQLSIDYLSIRIFGVLFVSLNASFRGFFNGIGFPKVYLRTLVIMHFLNILFNYILIFGNFGFPALGVRGAAIGTLISLVFGTLIYFIQAIYIGKDYGFLTNSFSLKRIKSLISISLPQSITQLFFASGLSALFVIIGKIGTDEMAGANILITIMLVAILPGIGFGFTSATLCSQALGRGDKEDAYQWGIDIVKVGFISISCLGLTMFLFPVEILSIFTTQKSVILATTNSLKLTGLFIGFDACGMILMHSLLGVGDSKHIMIVSMVLQWCFFLPLAYLFGPTLHYGLLSIWILQGSYRIIQAIIFARTWHKRKWMQIVL